MCGFANSRDSHRKYYSYFMRYLGIDHGGKRIGLAIGEGETRIAMPLETIEADSAEEAARIIALLIKEEGVDEVILGLPVSLDGKEGPQAKIARKFGDILERASGIRVKFEDERRSSKQAETLTKGLDMQSKDAVAAMVVLQSYLDKLH